MVPYGVGGGAMQALVAANPFLAQAMLPVLQARQQALSAIMTPNIKTQVHAPPSRIFLGAVSRMVKCLPHPGLRAYGLFACIP